MNTFGKRKAATSDYAWWGQSRWPEFCFTFIARLTPEEVFHRLLYCRVFGAEEAELFSEEPESTASDSSHFAEEIEALEPARRVAAGDVGAETLDRLEPAVDDLAMAYQATPPAELLERVRRHLSYVSHLVDAKKTFAEHRRLLTAGGWLALPASTCHIDLRQFEAAGPTG
ncbi:hypothetical protein [Streptosporangium sp. LJ11]|uniref:hypothetical protein n=1 Tax=Streptosporangium sp. LJ11 TaxID=3436927 RepID=UPI003F7AB6BA